MMILPFLLFVCLSIIEQTRSFAVSSTTTVRQGRLVLTLLPCNDVVTGCSPAVTSHHRPLYASTQNEASTSRSSSSSSSSSSTRGLVPRVTTVDTRDGFLRFLGQDQDQLCVVKFHSSYCKTCQRFDVKFRRWGRQVADLRNPKTDEWEVQGTVRLADVENCANVKLCRALGIKKFPFVLLYKKSVGVLGAFPSCPDQFDVLENRVERLLQMSGGELEMEKRQLTHEECAVSDEALAELQSTRRQ